jgi:hypothetical protein
MQKTPTITCVISSKSPETLRAAEQLAAEKVALDNVFTDVIRSFPRGTEKRRIEEHKLRDYFDGIQILDSPSSDTSFRLVFHPRPDAGRFWRDLIAEILRSIRDSSAGISTSITKSV